MKIVRHCLRVQDGAGLSDFYCGLLGMSRFEADGKLLFGYDENHCMLKLREGDFANHEPSADDLYWKIGITLRDLDHAVAYLRGKDWPVSEPHQFLDIGYMASLRDPEGFAIELLQQGFQGNAKPAGDDHPVGGQATLAHITLRIADLEAARDFCERQLGMCLMSVQPVPDRDFCLYFYAWSDEPLPTPDLEAVENREWLWARPYTLLELQHLQGNGATIRKPDLQAAGFDGFGYLNEQTGGIKYLTPADLEKLC